MKPTLYMSRIVFVVATLLTVVTQAQDLKDLSIVAADSAWGKEIIKFPVAWAPKMTIEGFEELRFSPGWSKKEDDQFWTYVLSWNITSGSLLTTEEIEQNLEAYFDGLMKPNHWAQHFAEPVVHIVRASQSSSVIGYRGKMKYFDGFHTGKMITTNIMAEQVLCKETNRTLVIFRISPKNFEHPVWNDLHTVVLKKNTCPVTNN